VRDVTEGGDRTVQNEHDPAGSLPERYRIVRHVRDEGPCALFEGRDLQFNARVIIRRGPRALWQRARAADEILEDARRLAARRDPHVIPFSDVVDPGGDAPVWLMRPCVEAPTVAALVEEKGRLPVGRAASFALQAARALASAHAAGVVHALFSPCRIIAEPAGWAYVVDFGLARASDDVTGLAAAEGLAFLAPEQRPGAGLSHERSVDVFAFGAVLYHMLTGESELLLQAAPMLARRQQPYLPLQELVPDVPDEAVAIVEKCLQARPERRYANFNRVFQDLQAAFPEATVPSRPGRHPDLHFPSSAEFPAVSRPAGARLWPRILVLAGILLVFALGIALVWRHATRTADLGRAAENIASLIQDRRLEEAGRLLDRAGDRFGQKIALRELRRELAAAWRAEKNARRQADAFLDRARELLDEGRSDEALEAAEAACKLQPRSAQAREVRDRARAAVAERDARQEIDRARDALREGRRAEGLERLRKIADAHPALREEALGPVRETFRQEIDEATREALELAHQGKFEEARARFDKARELERDARAARIPLGAETTQRLQATDEALGEIARGGTPGAAAERSPDEMSLEQLHAAGPEVLRAQREKQLKSAAESLQRIERQARLAREGRPAVLEEEDVVAFETALKRAREIEADPDERDVLTFRYETALNAFGSILSVHALSSRNGRAIPAEIWIDGRKRPETAPARILLETGRRYEIEIRHPRHAPVTRSVHPRRGGFIRLHHVLSWLDVPEWARLAPVQIEYARITGLAAAREVDLGQGRTMRFVLIPPGEFTMGDADGLTNEQPEHRVRITRPFYLAIQEVTVGQFLAGVHDRGSAEGVDVRDPECPIEFADGAWRVRRRGVGGEEARDEPMVEVSWHGARRWCEWLTRRAGTPARLPTEAQWEYACRAGTDTGFAFGDDAEVRLLPRYAFFERNSAGRLHRTCSKLPNPWGLYDLHGNVWEWCRDYYTADFYRRAPREDPAGPPHGYFGALRGGSWNSQAADCRAARRHGFPLWYSAVNIGFRPILEVPE
jgi:formylglycine-generating enzyme required for sulfatase activity